MPVSRCAPTLRTGVRTGGNARRVIRVTWGCVVAGAARARHACPLVGHTVRKAPGGLSTVVGVACGPCRCGSPRIRRAFRCASCRGSQRPSATVATFPGADAAPTARTTPSSRRPKPCCRPACAGEKPGARTGQCPRHRPSRMPPRRQIVRILRAIRWGIGFAAAESQEAPDDRHRARTSEHGRPDRTGACRCASVRRIRTESSSGKTRIAVSFTPRSQ